MSLDTMSIEQALELFNAQDAQAVAAVAAVRTDVARAVEIVAKSLSDGGRLFYVGAGTSGRLGVLDAAECPPTFRTESDQVQGIIAGGLGAMFKAVEGAEDDASAGAAAMDQVTVCRRDVVIGIAAGGTTPFVHGALRRASDLRARTIFLSCVQSVPGEPSVDVVIRPLTGPEILTGSTRLKAGTATKLILNQISTLAMVQLGKVYENLMVDLRATNTKLWDRGARIVATTLKMPYDQAMDLLRSAGGEVKTAIVMATHRLSADEARKSLASHGGRLSNISSS
jgi:N-acetylmuramic acid 6-phosphate etherase